MPQWNVHFDMTVRTLNPRVVELVANIRALASVIRGIPIPPYVQNRLDSLNISRAVRGTTGIEGTELSEEEVEQIMKADSGESVLSRGREREEQEARNAARLMRDVAQHLNQDSRVPLSEALVRRFHLILTGDIDYPHNEPGQYRTYPVSAGTYLPPETGDEVRNLMSAFIQWFNSGPPRGWAPIIRAIVAHFFVVSIHPFGDGNGRTSRAVESYLLYQAGINARGFYSLANYYYRRRSEYVDMLDHIRFRSDPDLTPFVMFALEGLVEELEAVHEEVLAEVRIIAFRDFAREALSVGDKLGNKVAQRQLRFLLGLTEEPVSLRELRSGMHRLSWLYRSVTTKTLMRDVDFLKSHDLILVDGDDLYANLAIMTRYTIG